MIFSADTKSDVNLCDDFNVQDHDSAGSAVCSSKKYAAPEALVLEGFLKPDQA